MMTGPGLALFYSGLVRKKNVLGVMMQCVFLMCLMTVIWATLGLYAGLRRRCGRAAAEMVGQHRSLVHERRASHLGRRQVGHSRVPDADHHRLTHMLFQGMFFIITPALICGAFAERMKFSTMVVFMILWGTLVYCPLCHAVWGGGILAYGSKNATLCRRRARLRRRHGRAHQFRRVGFDLRLGAGQAAGLRQRTDAAAQFDLHRHRRRHALGRLVRL